MERHRREQAAVEERERQERERLLAEIASLDKQLAPVSRKLDKAFEQAAALIAPHAEELGGQAWKTCGSALKSASQERPSTAPRATSWRSGSGSARRAPPLQTTSTGRLPCWSRAALHPSTNDDNDEGN